MTHEKRICRLCLHIISEKDSMQPLENIANIVQSILPTLNVNVCSNPIICGACNELVHKSYKFKLCCLETLETDNKFYMEEKNQSRLSTDVVKEGRIIDDNCCRFCSQYGEKDRFREFSKLEAGVMEICIPELDPSLMQNDVICVGCLDKLYGHYNFLEMCSNVEETIINYCNAQGKDVDGEVDIQHILDFSLNTDTYFEGVEVKEEKLEEDNSQPTETLMEMNENIHENCLIKQEISIKDESEDYGTHLEMEVQTNEVLKSESQKGRNEIECTELSKIDEYKQLSGRDPKTFRCQNCSYQTKYKSNLTKHMITHGVKIPRKVREEIIFQCTECTYITTNKQLYQRHVIIHKDSSEVEMFQCYNCSYQSKFKSSLARHMVVHRDPTKLELFKCNQCEYQTKRKMDLNRHTLMVHNSDVYKCHSCPYQTVFKHNLAHHMVVHRDPTELDMYKCSQCVYQSKRKNELIRHTMLIHKDSSLFSKTKNKVTLECQKCTYQTTERYAFGRHLMVHARDSQMYKCDHCPFETKFKHNLIQHLLVHKDPTQLKMFKCIQCEYQSKRKVGLKSHIMFSHKDSFLLAKGRKKIKLECLKCNYQTTEEHLLKKHSMGHKEITDSQMFQCHNCSFKTKFKSNLTKHMIMHRDPAELEMFKCSLCYYQSKRKRGLQSHLLFAHKDSFMRVSEDKKSMFAHTDSLHRKEEMINTLKLKCLKCNYQTNQDHLLNRHLKNHRDSDNSQIFKCLKCSFHTKFKNNLTKHMLVHKDPAELEMFKCNQCKYQAKRKKGLTAHMWFTHNSLLQ